MGAAEATERGRVLREGDSLEVVERQLLLAGVEDVPEVLDPHRRRRVLPEPEKKNEWMDWWGFWIGRI